MPTDLQYKQAVQDYLTDQGYKMFADRLEYYDFHVAEIYKGAYCGSAFMIPNENAIVVNPGFFELKSNPGDKDYEKEYTLQMDRVSVLVRHEILHFLLGHELRLVDYLKQKFPKSWGRVYLNPAAHRIHNFAGDYDICNEGYDAADKKIISELSLNGEYIGGLITNVQVRGGKTSIWFDDGTKEDFKGSQFNNWEHTSMEDMFEMLSEAHENYTNKTIEVETGAPNKTLTPADISNKPESYQQMYMKVFNKFKDHPDAAAELLGRLRSGEDIDIDTFKI